MDVDIAECGSRRRGARGPARRGQLILVIEEHAEGDSRVGAADRMCCNPSQRPTAGRAGAYSEPELHKYTDMQEAAAPRPRHEVDESGLAERA